MLIDVYQITGHFIIGCRLSALYISIGNWTGLKNVFLKLVFIVSVPAASKNTLLELEPEPESVFYSNRSPRR
jgi:hypothetical protein